MSTRVKADIMISRHAGSDGHLTLVRLADLSMQVLPLIGLWTVTLGSKPPFAALYANVRIWSVVFYKKLVVIPRLTTREGQPDGGVFGD